MIQDLVNTPTVQRFLHNGEVPPVRVKIAQESIITLGATILITGALLILINRITNK